MGVFSCSLFEFGNKSTTLKVRNGGVKRAMSAATWEVGQLSVSTAGKAGGAGRTWGLRWGVVPGSLPSWPLLTGVVPQLRANVSSTNPCSVPSVHQALCRALGRHKKLDGPLTFQWRDDGRVKK